MAHEVDMDEVGNEDVAEVLGSGQEDVSNEELIAMLEGSTDAENAGSLTHCESSRILTSQKMSKAFSLIQEAIDIFSENDPSAERSLKVSREIENSILCYRQLYKDKNKCAKQTSLVSYFSKKKSVAAPNIQESVESISDDSLDERQSPPSTSLGEGSYNTSE